MRDFQGLPTHTLKNRFIKLEFLADAGREDHAMFLPAVTGQEPGIFLPLAVHFQYDHGALTQFDLPAAGPGLGQSQVETRFIVMSSGRGLVHTQIAAICLPR